MRGTPPRPHTSKKTPSAQGPCERAPWAACTTAAPVPCPWPRRRGVCGRRDARRAAARRMPSLQPLPINLLSALLPSAPPRVREQHHAASAGLHGTAVRVPAGEGDVCPSPAGACRAVVPPKPPQLPAALTDPPCYRSGPHMPPPAALPTSRPGAARVRRLVQAGAARGARHVAPEEHAHGLRCPTAPSAWGALPPMPRTWQPCTAWSWIPCSPCRDALGRHRPPPAARKRQRPDTSQQAATEHTSGRPDSALGGSGDAPVEAAAVDDALDELACSQSGAAAGEQPAAKKHLAFGSAVQ